MTTVFGEKARVFQHPTQAIRTIAFSHGGTEKILVFSNRYSVSSVALGEYVLEHEKRPRKMRSKGAGDFKRKVELPTNLHQPLQV